MRGLLLGIDIGGTHCTGVIGDATGTVGERVQWRTDADRGPEAIIADIVAEGKQLLSRSSAVVACGVAVGGPLDSRTGNIEGPPNLPGWDNVPLAGILERELGLSVRVEHDATACALAEWRWGENTGDSRRLTYFTCGTGFGVGFVFDGEPYYGADGYPSDIGHIRLRDAGPAGYGKRGTIEAFCAAAALGRIATWQFPERWAAAPDSEKIAELAAGGDEAVRSVIATNAVAVGEVCALVCDLLHVDLIVLGSLAQYLGKTWLAQVRESFQSNAHPVARRSCKVEASSLRRSIQDLAPLAAAARLAEQRRW